MRRLTMVAIGLACVAVGRAQAPNPALVEARKAPLVEPKYEGKPRYLLLAIGQPVHRTIWCVVDGQALYVDRNADGCLDREQERFLPRIEKLKDHFISEVHEYAVGALPAVGGSPAYSSLELALKTWDLSYKPAPDLVEVLETLRANPSLRNPVVTLKREGKPEQFAMTEFAEARESSTVLHFDAPITWGLVENIRPSCLPAGKEYNLQVSLGTPGLGAWNFVITRSKERSDLRPEIDVAFAAGDGKKTTEHWVLPEWC
jgi:hypothetical protein